MHPHGSDRLRISGEQYILWSRFPKLNWVPRVPKTLTHSEHPGTAVLWDEQFFEVIYTQQLPNGAVEYTLEAWRDAHMIRVSDRYDAEGEQRRVASHRAELGRAKKRRFTLLFGMIAGHLPTGVQEQLGSELGVTPSRLTLMSLIPGYLAFAICLFIAADAKMKQVSLPIPLVVMLLVALAFLDAGVRMFVALSQSRPMGSPFGFVGYAIYYYVFARDRSKLLAPLDDGKGHRLFTLPPPDDVALRDDIQTLGPFLALLSPAEQKKMEPLGYDHREHAYGLAWIILAGCVMGVIASIVELRGDGGISALISMLAAAALAVEQIVRLRAFPRGPAGSVLGFAARPFVRKLLARG